MDNKNTININNANNIIDQNHRPDWNKTFIDITEILSKRSLCLKVKTAACIVCDNQIISIGYNGTLAKAEECNVYWYSYFLTHINQNSIMSFCDWIKTDQFKTLHREWSLNHEFHAESNALRWLKKNDNYIMYTLYSPCLKCCKIIISHNIKQVYYKHEYKDIETVKKIFASNNISCTKVE